MLTAMALRDINPYKYARFLVKRKLYFFLQRQTPVWRFINRKGVREFSRVVGSPQELKVANELKKNGVALCNLNELFGEKSAEMLSSLRAKTELLKANTEVYQNKKGTKDFFTHLSGIPPALDIVSPEIQLALSAPMLNIASEYFGFVPKLHNAGFILTHVVPEGTEPTHSQRWHRDPEDKKILKVFVSLSDIDEGAGPLNYVMGIEPQRKMAEHFSARTSGGVVPTRRRS